MGNANHWYLVGGYCLVAIWPLLEGSWHSLKSSSFLWNWMASCLVMILLLALMPRYYAPNYSWM